MSYDGFTACLHFFSRRIIQARLLQWLLVTFSIPPNWQLWLAGCNGSQYSLVCRLLDGCSSVYIVIALPPILCFSNIRSPRQFRVPAFGWKNSHHSRFSAYDIFGAELLKNYTGTSKCYTTGFRFFFRSNRNCIYGYILMVPRFCSCALACKILFLGSRAAAKTCSRGLARLI